MTHQPGIIGIPRRSSALCWMMAVLVGCMLLWVAPGLAASPTAGTSIGNQASATYTDASGVTRTVTSNIVSTIVQQVASLTLTADNTKYSAASGLVSFPHILTNTGNGTDSFALTIAQLTNDQFDLTNVQIFPDANGDGIADTGATPITAPVLLAAGASFRFVITGTVPSTVQSGNSSLITVTATSQFDSTKFVTNTDTTRITTNAVINATKSISQSSGAAGSGPYTYTITYTNAGNATALDVHFTDLIPAGMTYVAGSGRWSVTGTTPLTDADDGSESGIMYDYNHTTLNQVTAVVATVAAGESRTITFQVNVNANALAGVILNVANISYDDGTGTTVTGSTNSVPFTVTSTASVTITGQTVTSASQGATIAFNNVVTNTGNSTDSFDILVNTTLASFPPGTTYVLYRSDGATPLLDTNGNGVHDTGPLAPGASYTVVLKVTLPTGISGSGPYTVTKTARSFADPTKTATATDTLNAIVASTVDLTNDRSIANGATIADGLGQGPEASPIRTLTANPGSTVRFNLYINNTSSVADTYTLQGSQDPTFSTIAFPPGVTVTFFNASETVITNTGVILPGQAALVHADVFFPVNTPAGTYAGYFRAFSPTSGAVDIKHDAVTINAVRSITLVPNNTGQVFPGGSVVYTHTITNNGNVLEGDDIASLVNLTVANSTSGFSSAIYWDKNNNGVLDTTDPVITDLGALVGGTGGASTAAGLAPGESATLFVKVYAPASAAIGTTDLATLTAVTTQGTYSIAAPPPAVAIDTTTVIAGNLTITKQQALDVNCDGTPEQPYTLNNITVGAVPGVCIRYKLTITNTGTDSASTLVVGDSTPAYTVYDNGDGTTTPTGVAVMTLDGGTSYTAITAPADGAAGSISANIATLAPGATAIIYYGIHITP